MTAIKSFEKCRRALLEQSVEPIQYKIASSPNERAAAFRLIYDAYLRTGLTSPNSSQMRVTKHQLLPMSEIFVAKLRDEVISTFTLVADSDVGLPMEGIYGKEVSDLRSAGMRIAEITSLADRRSHPVRFLPVLLQLTRLMVHYARHQGINQLLMAVHPTHARFYQRFLACEPIGSLQSYPAVKNNPAIPLSLNFNRLEQERGPDFFSFLGFPVDDDILTSQNMSESEIAAYRELLEEELETSAVAG